MTTVIDLAHAWLEAKQLEKASAERRIEIEQMLLKHIDMKLEGSTTSHFDAFKITATAKLSYKADADLLARAVMAWPANVQPAYLAMKVDETRLKQIRGARPDLWAEIASIVEIKPLKTSITIVNQEE